LENANGEKSNMLWKRIKENDGLRGERKLKMKMVEEGWKSKYEITTDLFF
jgi:hypothetical protein